MASRESIENLDNAEVRDVKDCPFVDGLLVDDESNEFSVLLFRGE